MTDEEKKFLKRWLQTYWVDAIDAKKKAMRLRTFEATASSALANGYAHGFRSCCYSVLSFSNGWRLFEAMDEVDGWTKEVEEKHNLSLE
jgi:hypothetical protein